MFLLLFPTFFDVCTVCRDVQSRAAFPSGAAAQAGPLCSALREGRSKPRLLLPEPDGALGRCGAPRGRCRLRAAVRAGAGELRRKLRG